MSKMDARPVDRGGELRPPVQPGFRDPPVVAVPPVFRQLPQVLPRYAVGPPDPRQLIRPAGPIQAGVQIVQVSLRNVNAERADANTSSHNHVYALSLHVSLHRALE